MTRPTFLAHRVTVVLMAVGVLVATGDGFAQSYAGLYRWAIEHHLSGWKAESFPLLVDLFIAVGELGLFALALEGHRLGRQLGAWLDLALPFGIASAGWGVSLVFNVGAVRDEFADQATAAVPPVASMLGLLVLLRTLHRLVTKSVTESGPVVRWPLPALEVTAEPVDGYALWDEIEAAEPDEEPVPEPGPDVPAVPAGVLAQAAETFAEDLQRGRVPGIRPIKRRLNVGQDRAREVQAHLAVLASQ